MRRAVAFCFAVAALVPAPALAQDNGGGTPPAPPSSPADVPNDNRGMGAITDIPGQSMDPRTASENALAGRDGRMVRKGKRSSEAELAMAYGHALDDYVGKSSPRRLEALGMAKTASAGTAPAESAAKIRAALEEDLVEWSDTFGFDRATLQDQRDQWLTPRDATTAADWAQRRADWLAARDKWIAEQMEWAAQKAVGAKP